MKSKYSIIIDAYAHISPPKYNEFLKNNYPDMYRQILANSPPMYDLEERFRLMDMFEGLVQVLTVGPVPPIEEFAGPDKTPDMAKMANDEMAELTVKYRDRFPAAIALLPMNDIDAAMKETDRAIKELGFRGIYVHSNINGKPLDSPEFIPLWEKMAEYDLPIYIHPWRPDTFADYPTEETSKYMLASVFGWPYETTAAMTRIVFSGILEKYPNLKVVTHHCGGMIPYYAGRIFQHYGQMASRARGGVGGLVPGLKKTPTEYYQMFYNDTAIHGNTAALMCAYDFWGADHIVLGCDMPLGDYFFGFRSYRQTLNAIEAMDITDEEKNMILVDNAIKLLRLPI
jgi:predicted TIM-barrel fold metal-dependent hydrolase